MELFVENMTHFEFNQGWLHHWKTKQYKDLVTCLHCLDQLKYAIMLYQWAKVRGAKHTIKRGSKEGNIIGTDVYKNSQGSTRNLHLIPFRKKLIKMRVSIPHTNPPSLKLKCWLNGHNGSLIQGTGKGASISICIPLIYTSR